MKVVLYVCPKCNKFAVEPGKHRPCDAELVEMVHHPETELNSWISAYENLLKTLEAQGEHYEKFMVGLCQQLGLVYEDVFYDDVLEGVKALKNERDAWKLALQSLTPGGSEFTEPHECVAFVNERMNKKHPQRIVRLEAELAALKAERQWIPVSERLPEKDGYYIVRTISTHIHEAKNGVHQTYFYHDNLAGHQFSGDVGVTHWMPLPEPPKEQS